MSPLSGLCQFQCLQSPHGKFKSKSHSPMERPNSFKRFFFFSCSDSKSQQIKLPRCCRKWHLTTVKTCVSVSSCDCNIPCMFLRCFVPIKINGFVEMPRTLTRANENEKIEQKIPDDFMWRPIRNRSDCTCIGYGANANGHTDKPRESRQKKQWMQHPVCQWNIACERAPKIIAKK